MRRFTVAFLLGLSALSLTACNHADEQDRLYGVESCEDSDWDEVLDYQADC